MYETKSTKRLWDHVVNISISGTPLPISDIFSSPQAQSSTILLYPLSCSIDHLLRQSLSSLPLLFRFLSCTHKATSFSRCIFTSHAWQHVFSCTQAYKQRERDQPNT